MLRLTFGIVATLACVSAYAQTSSTGYQWIRITETLNDMIDQGYSLTTVVQDSVSGGVINTFYLSGRNDLVRCGEAYHVGRLRPAVFPCERLSEPR
jgi:hypothetical protein